MIKSIIVAVSALFLLTACAGSNKSVLEGGTSVTASIANPVTDQQLAAVEAAYGAAATAILVYARQPRCREGGPKLCSSWPVVQKLRDGNRIAFKQLENLRRFVAENKQVSAATAMAAALQAFRDLRATAFINGVDIKI